MSGIDFSVDAADRSQRCVGACSVYEGVTVRLQIAGLYLQHLGTERGKEIQTQATDNMESKKNTEPALTALQRM